MCTLTEGRNNKLLCFKTSTSRSPHDCGWAAKPTAAETNDLFQTAMTGSVSLIYCHDDKINGCTGALVIWEESSSVPAGGNRKQKTEISRQRFTRHHGSPDHSGVRLEALIKESQGAEGLPGAHACSPPPSDGLVFFIYLF